MEEKNSISNSSHGYLYSSMSKAYQNNSFEMQMVMNDKD